MIPIPGWVKPVAILAVVAVIAWGGWWIKGTLEENKRLKTELATANNTITALDAAAVKKDANRAKEREQEDEIDAAPETDDGPIAPVLLNTLNRLQ